MLVYVTPLSFIQTAPCVSLILVSITTSTSKYPQQLRSSVKYHSRNIRHERPKYFLSFSFVHVGAQTAFIVKVAAASEIEDPSLRKLKHVL